VSRIEAELDELNKANIKYPPVPEESIPKSTPGFTRDLLVNGVWIDKRGEGGYTSLHKAIYNQDAELSTFLLAHGADPAKKTKGSRNTALHLAVRYLPEILDRISDKVYERDSNRSELDPFQELSEEAKDAEMEREWGDLLQSQNVRGETPLHIAVEAGRAESVKWLRSELVECGRGTDIAVKDHKGRTPLHTLVISDPGGKTDIESEIATMLLEFSPEARAQTDDEGNTPLQLAVKNNKNGLKEVIEQYQED
jgi:ankyrin repeat protein